MLRNNSTKGYEMIKKILAVAAFSTLLGTTLLADGVQFLPAMNSSYTPSLAIAALGGYQKTDSLDGTGAYGIELSLTCPLLQIPNHIIRQQVSFVHADSNGIATNSVELNPHVLFDLAPQLRIGVGPSLGAVYAYGRDDHEVVFGIGAGVSLTYDIAPQYFVGVESRHQWTSNANLGGSKVDLDNSRTLLKVGVHF